MELPAGTYNAHTTLTVPEVRLLFDRHPCHPALSNRWARLPDDGNDLDYKDYDDGNDGNDLDYNYDVFSEACSVRANVDGEE